MNRTLDRDRTCELIKKMCEKKGIAVNFIVDTLNVSQQAVYAWYSAKKLPSLDHLVELADLLDVTTDDLIVSKEYASG